MANFQYLASGKVKVFPSGYRGKNGNTQIDPEARLNTERNFTLPGYIKDRSYIISKTSTTVKCIIHGYYFELDFSDVSGWTTTHKIAHIKTTAYKIDGTDANATDRLAALNKIYDTSSNIVYSEDLDITEGELSGKFVGIGFANTALTADGPYYTLDLTDSANEMGVDYTNVGSAKAGTSITGNIVNGTGQYSTTTLYKQTVEGVTTIYRNTASGNHSHAEGLNTQASSNCAHAEGESTKASGSCAHTEGDSTEASGSDSHAEGYATKASGNHSHAEGDSTKASGSCAHAGGIGTVADVDYATVIGRYNAKDGGLSGKYCKANDLFVVGNGASNTASARHNAFVVNKDKVTINTTDTLIVGTLQQGNTDNRPLVTLNGNVDAKNGLDVTGDSLTVGGSNNFKVDTSGNITTAGTAKIGTNASDPNTGTAAVQIGNSDATTEVKGKLKVDGDTLFSTTADTAGKTSILKINGTDGIQLSTAVNRQTNQDIYNSNDIICNPDSSAESGEIIIKSGTKSEGADQQLADQYLGKLTLNKDEVTISFRTEDSSADPNHQFLNVFKVTNRGSVKEGSDNVEATGSSSHAEGHNTQAIGGAAHAEGIDTKALKQASHAEGYDAQALEINSHAEGESTRALGKNSHTEGYQTRAYHNNCHTEGNQTEAYWGASHAEGLLTVAGDENKSYADNVCAAHAEGKSTQAIGEASHAEGESTKASGSDSHAEGYATIASGNYSHAEGYKTEASASCTHAEGGNTIASGSYSHAGGVGTVVDAYGATVIGMYNAREGEGSGDNKKYCKENDLFVVGNGSNAATRSNALVVNKDKVTINTAAVQIGKSGVTTETEINGNLALTGQLKGGGYIPESYLTFNEPGIAKSIAGDVTPIDNAMCADLSANRLAYLPAEKYTIEYSQDTGEHWSSYSDISSAGKVLLGTKTSPFLYTGGTSSGAGGNNYAYKLRITINLDTVYTRIHKILALICTCGTKNARCTVEYEYPVGTFKQYGEFNISGWSGWNSIPIEGLIGGPDHSEYAWNSIRLTFDYHDKDTNHSTAQLYVNGLRLFSGLLWNGATSEMARTGHLYEFDSDKNATFPNNVKAMGTFEGSLSGNATSATKLATKRTLWGQEFDGSANITGSLSSVQNITAAGTITAPTFIGTNIGASNNTFTDAYFSGTVNAASFLATSDARLKENLKSYKSEKSILDLPIYKYDFINGNKNQIGCLAQDLQEICPEIVEEKEDGYLAIQESKIVYLLLEEVKKLKEEITELKRGN